MAVFKSRKLALATLVYWILLLYIMAALVWWFIALQQQNVQLASARAQDIKTGDSSYSIKLQQIELERHRKTAQYIGEGSTFLLLIVVGAIFVYRVVRRQLRWQQQQQNFMMAVTHELKTPIAVASINLETLQKHQLDPAKQQKIISSALQETKRLDALASNILVSAQLEAGGYNHTEEDLDFSALVGQAVRNFANRFPSFTWNFNSQHELPVTGDTFLLQILVNNLLENAVKYAPLGTSVDVSLKKEKSAVLLTVADQGPGIPDEEKKKIFDKFYRTGSEQTRTAKGTGLGLYLCKKIVKDHRGQIAVMDNKPVGSLFMVTLPISRIH